MKKKIISILAVVSLCIVGSMPVAAQTVGYEFILENGQIKYGAYASKAADGDCNYYVTQTFTATGVGENPRTRYNSCYNGNVVSNALNLKSSDFAGHFNSYYSNFSAPAGSGYSLKAQYVAGTGSTTSQVVGRWTP